MDDINKIKNNDINTATCSLELKKIVPRRSMKKKTEIGTESPICEVNGSCITYASIEDIDRSNRISPISLLKRHLLSGVYTRTNPKTSDCLEINEILRLIRKHKLSPTKDLCTADLLQCPVVRRSPSGGATKLSESKLKEMIGSLSDNWSEPPDVEGESRGKRKSTQAVHNVRKSSVTKKRHTSW
jgi:hypothetical protein